MRKHNTRQSPAMGKNDCRKMYNVCKESSCPYIHILLLYTYIKIYRLHTSTKDNRRQSQYNTIKHKAPAMVKNDCRKMYNVCKESSYLYICILLWYTYKKIHRSHASAKDNRRQSQYNIIKYNHLQL